MTGATDFWWAGLTTGLALFFGAIASDARMFRSRQKEQQIKAATEALRLHYSAMRKLDDEQTPSELLDLALRLSKLVHDHRFITAVEEALRSDPNAFDVGFRESEGAAAVAFREIRAKRPDLARAFIAATASAMTAFITRWPHCAPAFAPLLVGLMESPAEETERVIRVTEVASTQKSEFLRPHAPAFS